MLNMNISVTMNGSSTFNGETAETYTATIDSSNPENISMSNYIQNNKVYRDNRQQCYADRKAFDDMVYAKQDEMIAAKATE